MATALLVGMVSGAAGTLLHQHWWGLVLALGTGLVVLAWLPPGVVRLVFAVAWCVPVLRGVLERPAGGFLVGADAPGWSFIAGSLVLLLSAALTARSGAPARGAHAEDPGVRGPAT